MSGASGELILTNKLLSYFHADADSAIDINATANNVRLLAQSALASFVGDDIRGQLKTVCDIVLAIKVRSTPNFAKGKVPSLVQRCIDRV